MVQMGRVTLRAVCLLLVVVAVSTFYGVVVDAAVLTQDLKVGFYDESCPNAESIVFNAIQTAYNKNKTVAPGILRIQFHDCMVEGCDASLLIDGADAEKSSAINANLHGFEAFDAAKTALEAECPGIVSCADIVAFSSRDTVVLTGGVGWNVPAGRRDGTTSDINDPIKFIPSSEFNISTLTPFFTNKGLTAEQMVDLSGAHTIGISHCFFIQGRLYAYPDASHTDPTLTASFLKQLQNECPVNVTSPFIGNNNNPLNMDLKTPGFFDTNYYNQLLNSLGLMISDVTLLTSSTTKARVSSNISPSTFNTNFVQSMIALTSVDVKIGTAGEIRSNCRKVNS